MITIITRDNCKFCNLAKNVLREHGLLFTEQKIGHDITREYVLTNYPQMKTLPIIINDGVVVGGYEDMLMEMSNRGPLFGRQILNEG